MQPRLKPVEARLGAPQAGGAGGSYFCAVAYLGPFTAVHVSTNVKDRRGRTAGATRDFAVGHASVPPLPPLRRGTSAVDGGTSQQE